MAKKKKKKNELEKEKSDQLPLTPMIDVCFLLLIFFMCASRFRAEEGKLEAYLPKDRGLNAWQSSSIDIDEVRVIVFKPLKEHIAEDAYRRQIYGGKEKKLVVRIGGGRGRRGACNIPNLPGRRGPRVNEPMLVAKLRELKAGYTGNKPGGLPVIIDGKEGECEFKHVVSVLNACVKAGIKNITFAAPEVKYW